MTVDGTAVGSVDWEVLHYEAVVHLLFAAEGIREVLYPKFRILLADIENVLHIDALPQLDFCHGNPLGRKPQPLRKGLLPFVDGMLAEITAQGQVDIAAERLVHTTAIFLQFLSLLVILQCLGDARTDDAGGNGENGHTEDSHDEGDEVGGRCLKGEVGDFPRVAEVFGECPHEGLPSVLALLGLCVMLDEIEQHGEHHSEQGEEGEADGQFVLLRRDGVEQESRRLHVVEQAHETEHPHDAERRGGGGQEEVDVKRHNGDEIQQAIERQAVAYPSPEPFIAFVEFVGGPDAEGNLYGETDDTYHLDDVEHMAVLLQHVEGGEEHPEGAHDNQSDDGVVHPVFPSRRRGTQVIVEHQFQFLLESHLLLSFAFHNHTLFQ